MSKGSIVPARLRVIPGTASAGRPVGLPAGEQIKHAASFPKQSAPSQAASRPAPPLQQKEQVVRDKTALPGPRSGQPWSHGPGVLQPKTAAAQQIKQRPTAPPVYRPQPVPKVLQAKKANMRAAVLPSSGHKIPVTPAVYKPHAAAQVLQRLKNLFERYLRFVS